jgi:hypothetical protein
MKKFRIIQNITASKALECPKAVSVGRKSRLCDLWWGGSEVGQIELPTIRGGRTSVLKTI